MSKSKGNVVDPSELVKRYGADTVRLFSLFAAPPERDLEWHDQGVEGAFRFLNRIFRFVMDNLALCSAASGLQQGELNDASRELLRKTHQTIRKVSDDLDAKFHFNTAISAVMELTNTLFAFTSEEAPQKAEEHAIKEAIKAVLLLLYPMVPHICAELLERTGCTEQLDKTSWPSFDLETAKEEELTIVIQVNGKLRGRLLTAPDTGEEELKNKALADEKVQKFIEGRTVRKIIVVKNKLINIVV